MNYGITALFRAIPLIMALFCFVFGNIIMADSASTNTSLSGVVVLLTGLLCLSLYLITVLLIRGIRGGASRFWNGMFTFFGYLVPVSILAIGAILLHRENSFVEGHIAVSLGLIALSLAQVVCISTQFSLIPVNAAGKGNERPAGAFSPNQAWTMIAFSVACAVVAWFWGLYLLTYLEDPAYVLAGHFMIGAACVCTVSVAWIISLIRQITNQYGFAEKRAMPGLAAWTSILALLWGMGVLLFNDDPAQSAVGYIPIGFSLVCFSLLAQVVLLSRSWRHEYPFAYRIPLIMLFSALGALFIAAFLYQAAYFDEAYFVEARTVTVLAALCVSLFSVGSVIESGINKHRQ